MLDDRPGLRRTVLPLRTLLSRAATDGRAEPIARLSTKRIDHVGHVARIDPHLLGDDCRAFGRARQLLQSIHGTLADAIP